MNAQKYGDHVSEVRTSARDEAIVEARERGWTYRRIAARFGISPGRVPQIIRRHERRQQREARDLAPFRRVLEALAYDTWEHLHG